MKISIIIPNYNGKHLLEKNLPRVIEAIAPYTDGFVEYIISDDHSVDGSDAFLQEFAQKRSTKKMPIIIVKNPKSNGFSHNINFAIKHATGDVLLLLNTDVVPQANFLKPLLEHFKDEKVFAVGCLEKTEDNGKQVEYGRAIGFFSRGFIRHTSADVQDGHSTFWVSCGSGIFRKSVWDKLGGLDEIYNPFYWEDVDISYRAVKCGYKILFEPKSIVHHNHEGGAIKSHFSKTNIRTIAYRNQIIFVWKNITDTIYIWQNILFLPYYIIKTIVAMDISFISGLISAVFLLPNIIQLRAKEKKLFVKSDKQILEVNKI